MSIKRKKHIRKNLNTNLMIKSSLLPYLNEDLNEVKFSVGPISYSSFISHYWTQNCLFSAIKHGYYSINKNDAQEYIYGTRDPKGFYANEVFIGCTNGGAVTIFHVDIINIQYSMFSTDIM